MKKGLDYFPLDTGFVRDPKIQRLLIEFGCEGLCVFMAVLCEVYGSYGYYTPIRGVFYTNIGFLFRIEEKRVKEIVRFCMEIELFDSDVYDAHLVLTSHGVQQRYRMIRRVGKNGFNPDFLLLQDDDFFIFENSGHNINNKINTEKRRESKEKESKEKESKEKESEEKKSKEKENRNKTEINYENEKSKPTNSDAARREELLRMAAFATRSGNDA